MRRFVPPVLAFLCGAAVGFLVAPKPPAGAAGPARDIERNAIVFAPTPDGSRVRHPLRVKRAVVPGRAPVEFEPVGIDQTGGIKIEPGEWVVVVDGRTYLLAPE